MHFLVPAFKDEKTIQLKDKNLLGKLDPKDFFMSETFSDVVVECQGDTYPAHRIILAGELIFAVFCTSLIRSNNLPCVYRAATFCS